MSIIKQLKPFLQGRENEGCVEFDAGDYDLLCSPQNKELFELAKSQGYVNKLYEEDGCTMYERGESHFLEMEDSIWYISTFRK